MVNKILFWTGFGIAVRLWQLGIEMRPFFNRGSLWAYPLFAGIGGSFGYWMERVSQRQMEILQDRKEALMEKRRRRAESESSRETEQQLSSGTEAESDIAPVGHVLSGSSWGR